MIIVDANIVAFYLIRGERSLDAGRLHALDSEWLVPPLWRAEFQSILWKYTRHGGMSEMSALALLDQAVELFRSSEKEPSPDCVLRDALRWKITVYDAHYITLARQLGVRCVTEDRPLQKACPEVAISLADFIAGAAGGNRVREQKAIYHLRAKRKAGAPS